MSNRVFRLLFMLPILTIVLVDAFLPTVLGFVIAIAIYAIWIYYIDKYRYSVSQLKQVEGKKYLLSCNCNDCTHWEIVRDSAGMIHLHCKTCQRLDEVCLVINSDQPAKWVETETE